MTVLFRADFQNTLTPEVGTYDNTSEKTGSFGLDGGEYYLQNSNTKGYYFYYLASGSDNSKLTITFDIAILNSSSSGWSVLFSGSNSNWWGLFTSGNSFSLNTKSGADTSLGSYSTSTWYTVKITQEVSLGVLNIKLYIDDVEKADISRDASYAITNLLLLGNTSTSWAAYGTVLKNVLITDGEEEEEPTPSGILKYLNSTGLSNLVTNIKNWVTARIPTKTSEITNDSGFITSSSLPTVNNATLTIQKNGTNVATFTANASSNVTANIAVPTKVSELTNDSGYITGIAWGSVTGKPSFATVATSGSYNDLSDKPTIPTVNNATLTIQKNGTNVKTFTANASSNVTCNITVPTKTSDLNNDSGFLTAHPAISTSTDTTSTGTPAHGGTFTCIDSVTRDSNGHVTTVNTKTVTLPADSNTDTKVTQAYSTTNNSYPVLSSATAGITSTNSRGATTAIVNNGIYTNPSTGALYATKLYSNGTEVLTAHQDLSLYPYKEISTNNWEYLNLGDTTTYPTGFDGVTDIGRYHIRATASTQSTPVSSNIGGLLIVDQISTESNVSSHRRCTQIFYRLSSNTVFTIYLRRGYYNSGWIWQDWEQIAKTSDIPTKTSELTNDSGFLTSHQSLSGYLPLTGGTLTGNLIYKRSGATRGTAPSSNVTVQHCDTRDSANNRITLIETTYYTDMSSKVALFAYKTTAASGSNIGSIGIGCTSSGTVYTFAPTPAASDDSTQIATTAFVKAQGYTTSAASKKLVLLAERSGAGTWTITCDTLKPIYFKFTASKNDSNAEFVVGIDGSSTCRLVNVNHSYSTNQFSYQVTNTSSGGQATWGIGVPTSSTITVSVWLRNTQFQRYFNIKAYQ